MRLTTRSHILVRHMNHWVGFNEFGVYAGTEPYVANMEERKRIIDGAITKVKKLNGKLHVR